MTEDSLINSVSRNSHTSFCALAKEKKYDYFCVAEIIANSKGTIFIEYLFLNNSEGII